MTLNKILCGISWNEPIDMEIELSATEIEACEIFLKGIIKHWAVLRNSSVDSLRVSFLQREGKLQYDSENNRWVLKIEKTTKDILLDNLPWSISMIKTPWMKDILKVEWS